MAPGDPLGYPKVVPPRGTPPRVSTRLPPRGTLPRGTPRVPLGYPPGERFGYPQGYLGPALTADIPALPFAGVCRLPRFNEP